MLEGVFLLCAREFFFGIASIMEHYWCNAVAVRSADARLVAVLKFFEVSGKGGVFR